MGRHSEDFLVRPLDTVWFRGPRPFVAGEDSADPGVFPPSPWSFQGMVRSRLLLAALPGDLDAVAPGAISQLVGPPDRLPAGWRLEGPFPARQQAGGPVEPWFPAPRFLLGRGGSAPVRARPAPALSVLSDLSAGRVLLGFPRQEDKEVEGWISSANLLWAMTGAGAWDPHGHRPDRPPFLASEIRPGIHVDRESGTAADHMLYAATHHRFEWGSGLLGRLSAASAQDIPDHALLRGWGQAGRTGRLVEFTGPVDVDASWSLLRAGDHLQGSPDGSWTVPDPVLAWVVLLTPAVAVDAEAPFVFPRSAVRLRVVGDRSGPGPDLGGFDRVGGGGRPLQASWAAGSAWLVELAGGSQDERLAAARSLQGLGSEELGLHEQMGLGQRVVGLSHPDTLLPIGGRERRWA